MATPAVTTSINRLFHAYDVRGRVDTDLGCGIAMEIARAYGDYLAPNGDGYFVIGHDVRASSPGLAEAVSLGLRSGGHGVTHIGLCSTPMLYWNGADGGYTGSVMITASHLPAVYNGMKFCREDAIPLSAARGLPEVRKRIRPLETRTFACSPVLRHASPLEDYARMLRRYLSPQRELKVAVDAGNGMGALTIEKTLGNLDLISLVTLGMETDPTFPERGANPLAPHAIKPLAAAVRDNHCDFGVAFDGDADRAIAVDESGAMIPPDLLGALIALHLLQSHPGAMILHDLRASRSVSESLAAAGGSTLQTRVGHAFIKQAMREHRALFALELSGHYYYADLHHTDNGLRTLIELINLVAAANRPLSQLIAPLARYPTSGEINLRVTDTDAALDILEKRYPGHDIQHLDGLSIGGKNWWLNARPSNTEPLLRLNVGATTLEVLERHRREALDVLAPFEQQES